MTSKEIGGDDSFIILGTSPGTSLDLKCNGIDHSELLDKTQLDDALKELSPEASMAFKAHFQLGDGPSPASLMVASTIITEDKSTEQLQKRFGEILDENIILKETLKQNNDSMKEQFLLIASCQEDMMKTHMLHKEKFDETRELVEKLRQENKKLKLDIAKLAEDTSQPSSGTRSGPTSALEFVTSPDDDTVNKLTAQLELVEKQRRQVIVDNEKLTWQKESLEHITDAITKERDELKEKLKKLELQLSATESTHATKVNDLNKTIQEITEKMVTATTNSVRSEELAKKNTLIQQLESKVFSLQADLKTTQLKVLELESVKLEFTKHKSGVADTVKMYKDQVQDLHNRLKDAQTTVFHPIRFSISQESEASGSEYSTFINNVKLYDKTLKHLADLLNLITNGASDSLMQTLGCVASLYALKLERATEAQFRSGLAEVKSQLERQHSAALSNVGQVRGTLTIFEGIFKDYNELLKKVLTKREPKPVDPPNVEALTAALIARSEEIQQYQNAVKVLRDEKEDCGVLKAQLDIYRTDFEAEREAREKMASEKDTLQTDLRKAQKRNQELLQQLEAIRKLNPNLVRDTQPRSTSQSPRATLYTPQSAPQPTHTPLTRVAGTAAPRRPSASATGNMSADAGRIYVEEGDCVLM